MSRMIQKKISIIIPTYKRPAKLQRAMSYYSKKKIPVFVADGSPFACTLPLEGEVSYFHLPEPDFLERLSRVINEVATPYACFAADDDFVSPAFLRDACRIMESDSSVAAVFGKCYSFEEKAPHIWRELYGHARSVEQDDFRERFSTFFGAYYPLFYAPTRTSLIKEIFYSLPRLPLRYGKMLELLHGALLIAAGKVSLLDNFYLARENSQNNNNLGRLTPSVQEVLAESPFLYETVNLLLSRWTYAIEENLFEKYIMEPYEKFCDILKYKSRRSFSFKLRLRIKLIIRDVIGYENIRKLEKIFPTIFLAQNYIERAVDLLEIEDVVRNHGFFKTETKRCQG